MKHENLPIKFRRKSAATAAALFLAGAGLLAVNVEVNSPNTGHDKPTSFSSVPPFANYLVPTEESQYIKTRYEEFLNTWTRHNPSMRHVSLDLVLTGTTSCNSDH